jgi:hypothetical protein
VDVAIRHGVGCFSAKKASTPLPPRLAGCASHAFGDHHMLRQHRLHIAQRDKDTAALDRRDIRRRIARRVALDSNQLGPTINAPHESRWRALTTAAVVQIRSDVRSTRRPVRDERCSNQHSRSLLVSARAMHGP